jgi:hypothetical protein
MRGSRDALEPVWQFLGGASLVSLHKSSFTEDGEVGQYQPTHQPKVFGRQGSADEWPVLKHTIRGGKMSDDQAMNEYEVTCVNGEVLQVEAWTPIIAQVIAEEEADLDGRSLSVVSVKLIRSEAITV